MGGAERERLGAGPWADALPARVPGSVHSALVKAGRIPDPKFGRNDALAHDKSFETWWLRRTFPRPPGSTAATLTFGGVAIHCAVWLNREPLGEHEGMFGGPEFDVTGHLRDANVLVVRIDPAPGDRKAWNNPDWTWSDPPSASAGFNTATTAWFITKGRGLLRYEVTTRLNFSPEGPRPDLPDPDLEFDLSDRPPTDEDDSVDAPASDDFAG